MAKKGLKVLIRSVWFFPVLLALFFLLLVSFKISGTSTGEYYGEFYGSSKSDPNLLWGKPQPIRSDEWLVATQMTIAQSKAGFPLVNNNFEGGKDMSLVGEAPYKDWSAIFKPENYSFFVMPLEYAFALKWWLLLFLTITAFYFLILRLFPGKRLFAAIMSTAISFTPFLFWWYQTATLAPIYYGVFIVLLGYRIINNERAVFLHNKSIWHSRVLYAVALAYLLACFGMVLYPPFQIPVAIICAAFLLGLLLEKHGLQAYKKRAALVSVAVFLAGSLAAGSLVLTFVATHHKAVSTVAQTVYPGQRKTVSGGGEVYGVFATYLQPQLQRESRAAHYYLNQSEASNFLLFAPFVFLPACYLLWYEYRTTKKIRWTLAGIQLVLLLFAANMYLGGPQILYKLTLLDRVPHPRMLIGLGVGGVFQLLLVVKLLGEVRIPTKLVRMVAVSSTLLCLFVLTLVSEFTRQHYPLFMHSWLLLLFLELFFAAILFAFISRKFLVGSLLLLAFSLGCVVRIHPVYHGLGPLYHNNVIQAMDSVSRPGQSWAVLDNITLENFGLLADRVSAGGLQPYPDLQFWQQVEGKKDQDIYNRYAHVVFTSDPSTKPLHLVQLDTFTAKFSCTAFIEKYVDFALSTHTLNDSCVSLAKEVTYPATNFYLYKVIRQ